LDPPVQQELPGHRAHRAHRETLGQLDPLGHRALQEVLVSPACLDPTDNRDQLVRLDHKDQLAADLLGCRVHKDHKDQRANRDLPDHWGRQDRLDNLVLPDRAARVADPVLQDQSVVQEWLDFPVRKGPQAPRDLRALLALPEFQDHLEAEVNQEFKDHLVLPDQLERPAQLDHKDFLVALDSPGTPEPMDSQGLPGLLDSKDPLAHQDLRVWVDQRVQLEERDFPDLQVELAVVERPEGPDLQAQLDRPGPLDPLGHKERLDLRETTDLQDLPDLLELLVDLVRVEVTAPRAEQDHREHKELRAALDFRVHPVQRDLQASPDLKVEWALRVQRALQDSLDLLEPQVRHLQDHKALLEIPERLVLLEQMGRPETRDCLVHLDLPDPRERWDRLELRVC